MRNAMSRVAPIGAAVALLGLAAVGVESARAHCDGMDGPVVQAAQRALATGNVNFALIWVEERDEAEVNAAFAQARAVRVSSPQSRELADRYFFETLVRLHRAGEGAPYTGLKPAGRDLGPAVPAADRALETGSPAALERLLVTEVQNGVRAHYADVTARRGYDPDDLAAGRAYVRAYMEFIHYVERLHQDATHAAEGHYADSGAE